jgi:HrpA-like RNA helicase
MTHPAPTLVTNPPSDNSPQARRAARIALLGPIEYPADLPVVLRRDELAQAILEHQVVIVCGETGSGKTTQLPKICISIGRGVQGAIAHTQPRRVAARTVASRIAHELKTELGGMVGYKIRFNDRVSPDTCIKLMTDGILLAEIQTDPLLKKYDTIIIDEAHERSLNIDFLLGYFVQILPRRRDLKLIITSATLDAERFAKHFSGAPILQVSGRSYPVEVRYRAPQQNEEGELQDVPQAVCSALDELSVGGLRGDVLVFLPGEREIRDTAEALRKHHPKGVEILPLFSRLSAAEQDRVFKPTSGVRRVVLATNVAETSLTVPNIGYVIDSGQARVNRYSIRQKVEQLRIEKISQAAANQRAGRCGRVMSGICVRLYDEVDFIARSAYTDAEIFRVSLATVILRMSALRLGEVEDFPFIEKPGSRAISDGYQLLAELGAIDETRKLTPLGRELAKFPLDPKIARLLLAGRQYHCLQEILVIASALSLQDPRDRPAERREAADAAHLRFNDERSDFLAYVKLWDWFQEAIKHKKTNRLWASECRDKFLSAMRLREWHELYQQLHAQVAELGWFGVGDGGDGGSPTLTFPRGEREQSLQRVSSQIATASVPSPPGGGLGRGSAEKQPTKYLPLPEQLKQRTRDLRKNATDAETLMWQLLRRNQLLEMGFRRQHPLGNYVLDFYCHEAKLVVELDGGQHNEAGQLGHDEKRGVFLQQQGLTVLRFWNNEAMENTEGVLQTIYEWLERNVDFRKSSPTLALPRGEREQSLQRVSSQIATASVPSPPGGGLGRGSAAGKVTVSACPPKTSLPATYEQIHKALLTGLLGNIGCKGVERELYYLGPREIKFFIAPNSVLAKKGAKWVVAAEIVETTKLYARTVARIEPEWLEEVAAHLIKRHYYDPHWEKKAAQVAAFERSTLFGILLNPKRRVHYGPMNVEESRKVFIRQALVEGEFNTMAPFFAHNQKLIHDIEALEHKSRRPDVLVDDELIYAFYDSRVPPGIHNGAAFEVWRKEAEKETPKLLYLQRDDLMRHEAAGITTDQFPPQLVMNNVSYALGYNFAPGKSDDGVTLTVPLALINQVSAARCEYLVPGLLAEKVAQLLKTLPQKIRRNCVPVPEFAAKFCVEMKPSDNGLLLALAKYIRAQKQLDVPLDAFRLEQLPTHLLMNFVVVDEHGRQLGVSRNFSQLRAELAPKQQAMPVAVATASVGMQAAESVRYTDWTLGDFKPTTEIVRAGQTITLFNALVDDKDAVALQAFDTRETAEAAHRLGLRRLFMLALKEQVKFLEKNLMSSKDLGQNMTMQFLPFGSAQDLQRQIFAVTFDRSCLGDPLPANEKEFAARCKEAKSRLNLVAQEIARLVSVVLQEYHLLQKSLPGFKAHTAATQDLKAQCEKLLHKEFIAKTPYERLQHLPRYLKAMNVRLEKLRADPARDARQFAQMQALQQAWQRKLAAQQGQVDSKVEEFGWMLQELRVSLFAQELKTPVIVSVKRLQKMWEAVA